MIAQRRFFRNAEFIGQRLHLCLSQRRSHKARTNRIAGNRRLGDFQSHHLGHAHHAMLGRHISNLIGARHQAMRRSDIDDPPPAARLHPRQRRTYRVEIGRHIDRDDRIPFFFREILDRTHKLDAGIIHQDINAPQRRFGFRHHGAHASRLGKVRRRIGRITAAHCRPYLGARRRNIFCLAHPIEHHLGPGFRQQQRNAKPNARG